MIIREEQKKKNRKDRESDGRIYLFRGTGKRFYPSNFWKYCSGAERACLLLAAAFLISDILIRVNKVAVDAALGTYFFWMNIYLIFGYLAPVIFFALFLVLFDSRQNWYFRFGKDSAEVYMGVVRRIVPYKEVKYIVRGDLGPCVHPFPGKFGPSAKSYHRRFGDFMNAMDGSGKPLFSLPETGDLFARLRGKCPGAITTEIEEYLNICREIAPERMSADEKLLEAWDRIQSTKKRPGEDRREK